MVSAPCGDVQPLQVGIYSIEVVDLGAERVLDPFVGVEAITALAHLDDSTARKGKEAA
jgi:hypothetical protein